MRRKKHFLLFFILIVFSMESIIVFAQEDDPLLNGDPIMPEKKVYLGDADMDGSVTMQDALTILHSIVSGDEITSEFSFVADTNENGILAIDDALIVLKNIVGSQPIKEIERYSFDFVENISMDTAYFSDNIQISAYEQLLEYLAKPEGAAWTKLAQLTEDFFDKNDLWIIKKDGYVSQDLHVYAKNIYKSGNRLYYFAKWEIPFINTGHNQCICASAVKIPKQDGISTVTSDVVLDYRLRLTQFEYESARYSESYLNEYKNLIIPTIVKGRWNPVISEYSRYLDSTIPEKDGSKTYGGLTDYLTQSVCIDGVKYGPLLDHDVLCFELYYPYGNEWYDFDSEGWNYGVRWYKLKYHQNTLTNVDPDSHKARILVLEVPGDDLIGVDPLIYLDKGLSQ